MVATFARLKLAILVNNLRKPRTAIPLLIGAFLGFAGLVPLAWLGTAALPGRPEWIQPMLVCAAALLAIGWLLVPLVVGFTDGTVDPSRLAPLPLERRELVQGLLVSSMVGVMPVTTALALLSVLMLASSITSAVIIVASISILAALCVLLSQVGSALLTGLARGRVGREAVAGILSLISIVVAVSAQVAAGSGRTLSLQQVETAAGLLRWTPGGWLGWGVARGLEGELLPALVAPLAAGLFTIALAWLWGVLLDRSLTTAEHRRSDADHDRSRWPGPGVLRPIRNAGTRAAARRAIWTNRRDLRALMALAGQLPIVIALALPTLGALARRDPTAVLAAGFVGFYGGMTNANLFGIDGAGTWLDLTAAPSMRSVVWGKTIANLVMVGPLTVLVAVALAAWTGGWVLVVPALAVAFAAYGTTTGLQAVASVRLPIPVAATPNPWSGTSSGAGCAAGLMVVVVMASSALLSLPGLLPVLIFAGRGDLLLSILLTPWAVGWGLLAWILGVRRAARNLDRDIASLCTSLAPRI